MTDKLTGPAAAAREIACISAMRSKDVEAIILKHCAQDKAEKLVEAVKEIRERQYSLYLDLYSALSDYEANK